MFGWYIASTTTYTTGLFWIRDEERKGNVVGKTQVTDTQVGTQLCFDTTNEVTDSLFGFQLYFYSIDIYFILLGNPDNYFCSRSSRIYHTG